MVGDLTQTYLQKALPVFADCCQGRPPLDTSCGRRGLERRRGCRVALCHWPVVWVTPPQVYAAAEAAVVV